MTREILFRGKRKNNQGSEINGNKKRYVCKI